MSAQSGLQRAINGLNSDSRTGYSQLNTQFDDGRGGAGANQGNSNRGQKDIIIRKNSSKTFRPTSTQRGKDASGAGEASAGGNSSNLNVKKKGGSTASRGTNNGSNGAAPGGNAGQPGHYRNKTQVVKKNIMMQNNQMTGQGGSGNQYQH